VAILELYKWQENAYKTWEENSYCGVIEAVTGAGKTRIAHEAILNHLRLEYNILIIVPSIDLQRQWLRDLKILFEQFNVKCILNVLGGGKKDINPSWNVLISVVNSIIYPEIFPGKNGLLIADECHHYGAPTFSKTLKEDFERRLGLTATFERDDNGIKNYLLPYFKKKIFSYGYKDAIQENVIAHFKIAFIGVKLNKTEQFDYENYNQNCRDERKKLIEAGVANEPFGEFIKCVVAIGKGNPPEDYLLEYFNDELIISARNYMYNFSQRRMLLANIESKYNCLDLLTDCVKHAERTIIFSQTQDSAQKASDILNKNGILSEVLNSKMKKWERNEVLSDFETGETEAVTAPLLLDEGINVPSADLAIIMASSRSRRQMVQRMGRVLRKKIDNRLARLVVFYGIETSEDPENGAHEDFMEDIINVADDFKIFRCNDEIKIIEYINEIGIEILI
jgi:RNA polymerase primary sigma factor